MTRGGRVPGLGLLRRARIPGSLRHARKLRHESAQKSYAAAKSPAVLADEEIGHPMPTKKPDTPRASEEIGHPTNYRKIHTQMQDFSGFTLIALMIVVAIIRTLASISIPAYQDYTIRAQVAESLTITGELKTRLLEHYRDRGTFPSNNEMGGMPAPEQLLGNYVDRIDIADGAMHVRFGNRVNTVIAGKLISLRPLIVAGSPTSPVSWLCGDADAPNGMTAVGENKTTLSSRMLPSACR